MKSKIIINLIRKINEHLITDLFINRFRHVKDIEDSFVSNREILTLINANDGRDDVYFV